jgi:hypothetical protein
MQTNAVNISTSAKKAADDRCSTPERHGGEKGYWEGFDAVIYERPL